MLRSAGRGNERLGCACRDTAHTTALVRPDFSIEGTNIGADPSSLVVIRCDLFYPGS